MTRTGHLGTPYVVELLDHEPGHVVPGRLSDAGLNLNTGEHVVWVAFTVDHNRHLSGTISEQRMVFHRNPAQLTPFLGDNPFAPGTPDLDRALSRELGNTDFLLDLAAGLVRSTPEDERSVVARSRLRRRYQAAAYVLLAAHHATTEAVAATEALLVTNPDRDPFETVTAAIAATGAA